MGNITKKQHFIPCSYLTRFSCREEGIDPRKQTIWVWDGERCRKSIVENEGYSRWLYGKGEDANASEKMFQVFEQQYVKIMNKLSDNIGPDAALDSNDEFALFYGALMLYIRNQGVRVEEMDTMSGIRDGFWSLLGNLLGIFEMIEHVSAQERLDKYRAMWQANLHETGDGGLITSDNPVVLWALEKTLVMVYLALDKTTFIAFHRVEFLQETGCGVSNVDIRRLHGACYGQRLRFAYADHDFSGYLKGDLGAKIPRDRLPIISPGRMTLANAVMDRPFDFLRFRKRN